MAKIYQANKNEVTRLITERNFPSREQLERQTGYNSDALFAGFWLMYAENYGLRNKSDKHAAAHYNDVGTSPRFRKQESGFEIKPKGIIVGYHHDSEDLGLYISRKFRPEDALAATHVVIDIADKLLSRQSGMDLAMLLSTLTDKSHLIFLPVTKRLETLAESGEVALINRSMVLSALDSSYNGWEISPDKIEEMYYVVMRRMESTVRRLLDRRKENPHLSDVEVEYISDTITGFIADIGARIGDGLILKPADLQEIVRKEWESVRGTVSGELENVDPMLLPSSSSETLAMMEKTLYRGYIKNIMAVSRGYAGMDEDPGLIKACDARDTASKIGPFIYNVVRQFRKYRMLLDEGSIEVAGRIHEQKHYGIFRKGLVFLYNALDGTLKDERNSLARKAKRQTQFQEDLEKVKHMVGLMRGFDRKIGLNLRPTKKTKNRGK